MRELFFGPQAGSNRRAAKRRESDRRHRLSFEPLEDRRLLSVTHAYTFNNGTAADSVGAAHGTLVNGAYVVNGRLALYNFGVTSGDAANVQHVALPANTLPASGSATIEVWYQSLALPNWSRVFDFGDQITGVANSSLFFSSQTATNDSRAVLDAGGAATEKVASGVTTDDGRDHYAAVVIDSAADRLRLYLDGVQVANTVLGGAHAGSVNDVLGYLGRSLYDADPGFSGWIDEVRIHDEALDAATIAANNAAGATGLAVNRRQVENLDRGIVAIRRSTTQAYVSWRLLASDPQNVSFNVYRSANGAAAVKLNTSPITTTTDYTDSTANFAVSNTYHVRAVINGVEQAASPVFTILPNAPVSLFLNVPLQIPAGGTTPSGETYTYEANDASVGDVDGDGQYEIILKWQPTNAKDNSQSGYTGNTYVDAYKLNGTRLWRIDLGVNIRAGAHYTQMIVYDLDGDNKAEVVLKTAEGTVDGVGTVIGNAAADYRNTSGYILSGPEYLTVFNGQTGAIIHSLPFRPTRGSVSSWGDSYGNRVDRFQATIAYLDGIHPSIVWGRGYAGPQSGFSARNEVAAFDYVNGQLQNRWLLQAVSNGVNSGYVGQSAHSITVGDLDGDGKDEVITGASAIDDNGTILYNTGLGHGDALHLSDQDPTRPGLELFMPHENTGGNGHIGSSLRDARTGQILHGVTVVQNTDGSWPDIGRAVAADIDPNSPGYEHWALLNDPVLGTRQIYAADGTPLYAAPSNMFVNFLVWWDADVSRELLDGTTISDWNNPGRSNFDLDPATSGTQSAPNASSNNGTKSTPALVADILGDWREEVIWRRSDNTALQIFTTGISATSRLTTLMHDTQYRQAIAWQNSGYNQPPHPSFNIGGGMLPEPKKFVYFAGGLAGDFNVDGVVDAADYTVYRDTLGSTTQLAADASRNGIVDAADYAVWRANFGQTAAASAAIASAIPTGIPVSAVTIAESPVTTVADRPHTLRSRGVAFQSRVDHLLLAARARVVVLADELELDCYAEAPDDGARDAAWEDIGSLGSHWRVASGTL